MAKGNNGKLAQKIGFWVFLLGVILSLVAGFWELSPALISVLIVLGLIAGFLNVTATETTPFLLAVVALVVVTAFGGNVLSGVAIIGERLAAVLNAIIVFVVPATIVVSLRAIYGLAKDY